MINLRYHVVSITAVFLALGIGIAMGSSFLGAAAVDRVDENIRDVRREAAEARAERNELRDQVDAEAEVQEELYEQGPPTLFTSDLADVPVVLITVGGVDDRGLDATRTALESSLAAFDGVLRIDDKVIDEGAEEELAELLEVDASGTELRDELVDALAEELVDHGVVPDADGAPPATTLPTPTEPAPTEPGATEPGPTEPPPADPTDPTPTEPAPTDPGAAPTDPGTTTVPVDPGEEEVDEVPEPDVVRALVAAGFLSWEPAPGGPDAGSLLGGTDYRYVVVTGTDLEVPDSALLLPVLEAMAADGPTPVVVASAAVGDEVGDREEVRDVPLAGVREDDVLRDRISTVDDLEVFPGIAAVMEVVDDLAGVQRGHYGLGEDRDSLLPSA